MYISVKLAASQRNSGAADFSGAREEAQEDKGIENKPEEQHTDLDRYQRESNSVRLNWGIQKKRQIGTLEEIGD